MSDEDHRPSSVSNCTGGGRDLPMTQATGPLQLTEAPPETPRFQRRAGWLQRLGWLGLLAFLLAGAAGSFGQGPLARRAASSNDGLLSLEYDRVAREGAVTRADIRIEHAAVRDEQVELRLGKAYLSRVQLVSITPEPATQRLTPDGVLLRFDAVQSARPLQLRIDSEPVHAGIAAFELSLANGSALRVRQAVLP